MAESSSYDRGRMACKTPNIYYLAFYGKNVLTPLPVCLRLASVLRSLKGFLSPWTEWYLLLEIYSRELNKAFRQTIKAIIYNSKQNWEYHILKKIGDGWVHDSSHNTWNILQWWSIFQVFHREHMLLCHWAGEKNPNIKKEKKKAQILSYLSH